MANYKPKDILIKNYIGGNSGNMLFLYGVINALTTETATCEITNRKSNWSDAEIEIINEEYDGIIMPMADAFRADYVKSLRNYTNFIKKLRIPCVIIGVGLRAEYEPKLEEKRPFDEDVKAFVTEVLNHSSQLGLRGEITGRYLEKLGFIPDRDFTVIGCPSLYMHGTAIEEREPNFANIGINLNAIAPNETNEFYVNLLKTNKNIHIIQQRGIEFEDWYYGRHVDLSTFVPEYPPCNIFKKFDYQSMKKEDRVHFYLDVPSWINSVKQYGAFAGCRFHGVVAAILAGVPSVITPIDARTREFAQFHHIPQIKHEDIAEKQSLEKCFENTDLSQFHKHHRKNMENYLSFLSANNLESIFDASINMPFGSSPMEKKVLSTHNTVLYPSYEACKTVEKLKREAEYLSIISKSKIKKILKKL